MGFIAAAIVLDALAYRKLSAPSKGGGVKGLVLAVLCGLLMANFYRFVQVAMPKDFSALPGSKLTPYTAMVAFSLGVLVSNFVFNTLVMIRPFSGAPLRLAEYFRGSARDHLWGVVGGMIWSVGMTFSIIALGKAGPAISYGLGQGATMVAALWGVFILREFRQSPRGTSLLLALMFAGYLIGLALIVHSGA